MSILFCNNLDIEIAGNLLLENITFRIEHGDKVGLIGPNGAGKTTLLRAIVGDLPEAKSNIELSVTLGYLPQISSYISDRGTVFEAMLVQRKDVLELRNNIRRLEIRMSEKYNAKDLEQYGNLLEKYERIGGYALEAKIRKILAGLGLENEQSKDISLLSGGQKTRLALGKLLLKEPELLVLDEPTNHLDIEALEWLEKYLDNYSGSLLIVSHDRFFLDRVVNRILLLENGVLKQYFGNFSAFELQKALEDKSLTREVQKINKKIASLEEYIRRYKEGRKAKQARGRELQLKKISRINVSKTSEKMNLSLGYANRTGELVLDIKDLSIAYGDKVILKNINLTIRRGDRIALLGRNGIGKTSLLKAILGKIQYKGMVKVGANVSIGYYSQEHEEIGIKDNIIDEIRYSSDLDDFQIRNILAKYGFRGDVVFKKLDTLSGGEKSRLALCKLFLAQGNLLLLDEPTNHLDIETRDLLEEALQDYNGTVLIVSHDRYFLNKIINKVAILTADDLKLLEGDYTTYLEYKEKNEDSNHTLKKNDIKIAKSYQEKSKNNRRKERRKKYLEQEIEKMEAELKKIEIKLESLQGDYEQVLRLNEEYNKLKIKLDKFIEEWIIIAD